MKVSHVFVKLLKLYLLLWILYVGSSRSIEAWNTETFDDRLAGLFQRSSANKTSLSLIVAHPDDEVMFFAPTLLQLNLMLPEAVDFNVICLSTGNADSLGQTRERELKESVGHLFANSARNVQLFQFDYTDGKNVTWDAEAVSSTLENEVFLPQHKEENVLLTFDPYGVSSHPNHISCHDAAEMMLQSNGTVTSVIYLDSHSRNFVMKYSSFFWSLLKVLRNKFSSNYVKEITLISTYPQYLLSLATMTNAHQSQLVWFRYCWWFFSSFVFSNDLKIVYS